MESILNNPSGTPINDLFWNGMFWNQLIYPEHALDEVGGSTLLKTLESEGGFPDFVACLCLDGYSNLLPEKKTSVMQMVAGLLEARLPENLRRLAGFTHVNAFYFCGIINPGIDENLQERLEALRQEVCSVSRLPSTLGIAFTRGRSLPNWRSAAQHAVVAQRRKVRFGCNRTYIYEESFLSPSFSKSEHWRFGARLDNLVKSGDPGRTDGVLREVSGVLFRENYLPLNHLRPILQSHIILMAQTAREAGADDDGITPETESYLSQIAVTFDYSDLKSIFESAAENFTRRVHNCSKCLSGRLVSEVERIIKACLDDPGLGLKIISQTVGTNPSYLSRRFKQEKGIGLSEYINMHRIEKAKRLLMDGKLGITEVAYAAGFGSMQNFDRVFRQVEDMSPRDWRKSKSFQNE
jgi:AraC-like DNA-binding protein